MNNKSVLRAFVVLLVLVVFFGVAQSASADLKATAVFSILSDENPPIYRNSTVQLQLDGDATHVIHELGTDNDDYFYSGDINNTPQAYVPFYEACQEVTTNPDKIADCPVDTDTTPGSGGDQYEVHAGVLELGIPREDGGNGVGTGAFAFENSAAWTLIDCDLNDDNTFSGADLDIDTRVPANYPDTLAPWDASLPPNNGVSGWNFKVLAIDDVRECNNNTCFTELVTTIFLDLDTNNNGVLDVCPITTPETLPDGVTCEIPDSGSICFFAEIYPIVYAGGPVWGGNAQARFSAGGGDKTVNLNVSGPDAITLENLVAQSPGGIHPYVWLTIAVLLTGIAFVLIRESRIQNREIFVRKDE